MSFLVCATAGGPAVALADEAEIATSFPGFVDMMNGLGAAIARRPAADDDAGERAGA